MKRSALFLVVVSLVLTFFSVTAWGAVTFSGAVTTKNGGPVAGAVVALTGTPSVNTTTGINGAYSLSGLPANTPFTLSITANGYLPVVSMTIVTSGDIDATTTPFTLFTSNDLTGFWDGSKGMIFSGVVDMNSGTPLDGVNVTASVQGNESKTYTVYAIQDGSGPTSLPTTNNGLVVVPAVTSGETVILRATKNGVTFMDSYFPVQAGVVAEGPVFATSGGGGGGGGISLSGKMADLRDDPFPGVTVSLVGGASTTTTTEDGSYTLTGLPSGSSFEVKAETAGYVPTYSPLISTTEDINGAYGSIFTKAELQNLNLWTDSKGLILLWVYDSNTEGPLGGVTATAQGTAKSYPVSYLNGDTLALGGSATDSKAGMIIIKNVDPGDTVTVTVSKSGVNFSSPMVFTSHADAVSYVEMSGMPANPSVSFTGKVTYSNSSPAAGVTIQQDGIPSISTTSAGDGGFTLAGLPRNPTFFTLKFSKNGYVPVYSAPLSFGSDVTSTVPFAMFSQAELAGMGVWNSGKGVIVAKIVDTQGNPVTGATVNVSGGSIYTVQYESPGLTATGPQGVVIVPNVNPGETVYISAQKVNWNFYSGPSLSFAIKADSVHEGALIGTIMGQSNDPAATVTGNVENLSGQSGWASITLVPAYGTWWNGSGTSVRLDGTTQTVPFTIDGVPVGTYTLKVSLDRVGNGSGHVNDPSEDTSLPLTVVSGTVNAGTVTLHKRPLVSPRKITADKAMATRTSDGVLVLWDSLQNQEGVIRADRYTIEWSVNGTTIAGSKTIAATGKGMWFHGAPSGTYQYRLSAVVDGLPAVTSDWIIPVAQSSGGTTVSGTVSFSGTTTGPLYAVLYRENQNGPPTVRFKYIASPASPQSYSISDVPAGSYSVYPVLDMDNNGTFNSGDLVRANSQSDIIVDVGGVPVTASPVTLPSVDVFTNAKSTYQLQVSRDFTNNSYSLEISAEGIRKRVTKARLIGTPSGVTSRDIAPQNGRFSLTLILDQKPIVGETYTFAVTFDDNTTATVAATVTGVIDSLALPLAPSGPITYTSQPTFTWQAPTNPPGGTYYYNVVVSFVNGGNWIWESGPLPSSQTSVQLGASGWLYGQLIDGTEYRWGIRVQDTDGNAAERTVDFTPTSAPVITGFTPAAGNGGASVTIKGINFNATSGNNTVTFNGVIATVTGGSTTQLTVTAPNASTGQIMVSTNGKQGSSATSFVYGSPISFTGKVNDSNGTALTGVTASLDGNPAVTATSNGSGIYTLNGLPANSPFQLRLAKTGYADSYSSRMSYGQNTDNSSSPYSLYTPSESGAWGVKPGYGVIRSRVYAPNGTDYLAGAVVTAQSSRGRNYQVTYTGPSGTGLGGTATYSDGFCYILNVEEGDFVTVSAQKTSYRFTSREFDTHADSVSMRRIPSTDVRPTISGFTPDHAIAGTVVTITGTNFSVDGSGPNDNTVTFANSQQAVITGGNSTQLYAQVPAGAITGPITVITADGSATSSTFTKQQTLNTAVTPGDGGLVTAQLPASGITCPGDCSEIYDYGTLVALSATANLNYSFLAWSGNCSGDTCAVTMTTDKSVTATFVPLDYVRIQGGGGYASLSAAFVGIGGDGALVKMRARTFTEGALSYTRPFSIVLKGGYDATFTDPLAGTSILEGIFTISTATGSVTMDNFIIK